MRRGQWSPRSGPLTRLSENSNADATKGGKVEGAEATRRKDAIMVASENLVRDILSRRDDNAVMMMSLWVYNQDYSNGADKHAVVSEFYDVPRISTRPFFYQYLMQNMDELGDHYGAPDFGHQVQLAHQYISDTRKWSDALPCTADFASSSPLHPPAGVLPRETQRRARPGERVHRLEPQALV